jgi:LmbE family N-acetylglucosaminyl deacetylase
MKYASNKSVFKMYEYIQPFLKYSTPVEDKISGNNVLVIAPHQDDESIGCAGTIIKHVRDGGHLEIVFCTSDNARAEETREATKILGSSVNHFFQFEVGTLHSLNSALASRFTSVFKKSNPDVIFLPFMLDNHADHIAISRAFVKSYKQNPIDCLVYAYPVWGTLMPNTICDITGVWEDKKRAIECYKSQTATRDYVKMASSIAQFWAIVKGKNIDYAETFFKSTSKEYVSLVKRVL